MATNDLSERLSSDRIRRLMYFSIGVAALIFAGLHVGQMQRQLDVLEPWFGYTAIAVGAIAPSLLVVLVWFVPMRVVHWYVRAVAVAFFVTHALWLTMMTAPVMDQSPWLQNVNAIPAVLAAVAWPYRWVMVYAFIQLPLVSSIQQAATGGPWRDALLSGVVSTLFAVVVMGTALALVQAALHQDVLTRQARDEAAREAEARTRERERSRVNAIVRDEVMSALVVAGREPYSERVALQAESALSSIARLTEAPDRAPEYTPVGAIAALRAAVDEAGSADVDFWQVNKATEPVPSDVIEAFSEAIGEAVRNSIKHGGDEDGMVNRLVRVTMSDGGIEVRVEDTGRGFNPLAIPERRLGIRVSIFRRMRSIEGGKAHLDSRPGRGTVVTLTWRKP